MPGSRQPANTAAICRRRSGRSVARGLKTADCIWARCEILIFCPKINEQQRGHAAATDWLSIIKSKKRDVAVREDVFLALEPVFAGLAGGGDGAEAGEIVIGNDLGLDEALLEIGVDDAGGLRGLPAFLDRPGAHFLFAGREVGHQAEQAVGGLEQPGYPGAIYAGMLQARLGFLPRPAASPRRAPV